MSEPINNTFLPSPVRCSLCDSSWVDSVRPCWVVEFNNSDTLSLCYFKGVNIVTIKIGKLLKSFFPELVDVNCYSNYCSQPTEGPIEKNIVNVLLSEALCMPPSLCRPLAHVVHNKTGGIIMFVLRFLASLTEERDLWFSMSSR